MADKDLQKIFKTGSKTFFNASKYFPKDIRGDVTRLYAFVRVADDLVDGKVQNKPGFEKLKKELAGARKGKTTGNKVVDEYAKLEKERGFDQKWMDAFLESMGTDLTRKRYKTIKEVEEYMYGSANVIGLFMAKIMGLPKESYKAAEALGKAFQFVNFIRDIEEDLERGRRYLPAEDIKMFGLKEMTLTEVRGNREAFEKLVRFEIGRYREWQKEAEAGFEFIPKECLVPIKTASDMYKWTANKIEREPMRVFRRKMKPSVIEIVVAGLKNKFALAGALRRRG